MTQENTYPDFPSESRHYPNNNQLEDCERKEAALAAYEEAIQLSPYEPSFYQRKGQVLEQLGRLAEAQRAYEDARRLGYRN